MGSPNNARNSLEERQYLRDLDLRRWNLANDLNRLSYSRPDAFEELVKEIAKGNRTLANQILRGWGIW